MIDVNKWLARISRAEDYMNERRKERLQTIRLYTGTFFNTPLNNDNEVSDVNFLYEYVDVLVSAIYAKNPFIFVRPTSNKWVPFAETMEQVVNYYIRELGFKRKMQQCIINAVLQPPGWICTGYLFINEKTRMKKEIEEEFPELKDLNKKEKTESEMGFFDETVKIDDCFIEHISPWNVFFPEGYHNIRECPYIIIRQKISLEDLYANPMYKDIKYSIVGQRQGQSKSPQIFRMSADVSPSINQSNINEMDRELIKIDLYHVWDRRSMQRFTLAKNFREGTLFERDWDYLSEGFPVFPLIFNEVPETDEKCNAYPMSDAVPMFPQLKELSLISSAMMRHRKRAGTLLLAKQGVVSEDEINRIQSASDVDLVVLRDLSESSIRGFTPPALPQDFYALREQILEDLYRITGYKQLMGASQGIDTATESDNVKAGSILRQTRRIDIIEEFARDFAVYFIGLLWQFKTKKQISDIIGEEVTEDMWPTLPKDQKEARRIIQKQLQLSIEAGSSRPPKDEAVEKKQWLDSASVLKANFPNRIKDDVLVAQIAKKMGFKDLENMVITHDEQEVAAAQEENKLLMQNIPQVVSPNENHQLHLQVHSQVYQVPGMTPTDAMNQHIDSHAKFMEQNSPKASPQRGDAKLPNQTTTPDITRQGVTEYADILGGVSSTQEKTGVNTGG